MNSREFIFHSFFGKVNIIVVPLFSLLSSVTVPPWASIILTTITWEVPKEFIGEPGEDDVLTNTWSNVFRRLGFIGRIGLTRVILDNFIFRFFGNSMWDHAPDSDYGMDYTIQYWDGG